MMDSCCSRFTAAEGGARLAANASTKNILATEYWSFIATRLVHEEAYKIRGCLCEGNQRSIYVTRASRIQCVAYDLRILTDLSIIEATMYDDVYDWAAELDKKEVLVCTSSVLKRILEEEILTMTHINVLIIDSCHLICKDVNLKYIMNLYKECDDINKPRILALTYPIFVSNKIKNPHEEKENLIQNDTKSNDNSEMIDNPSDETNFNKQTYSDVITKLDECKDMSDKNVGLDVSMEIAAIDASKDSTDEQKVLIDSSNVTVDKISNNNGIQEVNNDAIIDTSETSDKNKAVKTSVLTSNDKENTNKSKETTNNVIDEAENIEFNVINEVSNEIDKNVRDNMEDYENLDDFNMYEQLEWKIENLERDLCSQMDLAEDIDGGKRLPSSVTKPKEVIIEHGTKENEKITEQYIELETFMRETVNDALAFIDEHRHDPSEIYGDELYEEFKNIPDPTIDPRIIFQQFLYILNQLGPYAADKAAISLLTKIEKLKIKVPYERHFLLLCLCTTIFVKIRCYADLIFSQYESDWDKIKLFCTPKVLRFAEILEKFQPEPSARDKADKSKKVHSDINSQNKDLETDKERKVLKKDGNESVEQLGSIVVDINEEGCEKDLTHNDSNNSNKIDIQVENEHINVIKINDEDVKTCDTFSENVHKREAIVPEIVECDNPNQTSVLYVNSHGSVIEGGNQSNVKDVHTSLSDGEHVGSAKDMYSDSKDVAIVENIDIKKDTDSVIDKISDECFHSSELTKRMLKDIEDCDFTSLGDKIEDRVNMYQANLKDLDDFISNNINGGNISKPNEASQSSCNPISNADVNSKNSSISGESFISTTSILISKDNSKKLSNTSTSKDLSNFTIDAQSDVLQTNIPKLNDKPTISTNIPNSTDLPESSNNGQSNKLPNDLTNASDLPTNTINIPKKPNQSDVELRSRRSGPRTRGRGRGQRQTGRGQQGQLCPDALCGLVFTKEPLVAKILFMLVVDMSRSNSKLSHLCAQYCIAEQIMERSELKECQRQNKKQEEVLKKFRMHECNLLLATPALEEGIDLPRCNLVLRWDLPPSYRSYGLCRSRARAPRASSALLCSDRPPCTDILLHNVATYKELDQIISRKCGCGIQDEPPQIEEDEADPFTAIIKPYTPKESFNNNNLFNKYSFKNIKYDKNEREKICMQNIVSMDDKDFNTSNNPIKYERNSRNISTTGEDESNNTFKSSISESDEIDIENNISSDKASNVIKNELNHRNIIDGKEALLKIDKHNEIYEDDINKNNENTKINVCSLNEGLKDLDSVNELNDRNSAYDNITRYERDTLGLIETEFNTEDKIQTNMYAKGTEREAVDRENTDEKISTENCDKSKVFDEVVSATKLIKNNEYKPEIDTEVTKVDSELKMDMKNVIKDYDSVIRDAVGASVDLNSAIALINRYCGKLPSDTFTRLAPQWWMEEVQLPLRNTGEMRTAYICTLRLPLNCPVKYNIVGHPMPTKVLARRMVALQACRILHKSGELDNQLMPIGKENFKAADLEATSNCNNEGGDINDIARPGTTKRRQYYFKRTALAFTDCQPIVDTSDSEIDPPVGATEQEKSKTEETEKNGTKRNMLYALTSTLRCALPERYNTRGRRLHAPQNANQAIGILMAREAPDNLQIPSFPVYTRSGEVRVSVELVPDADVRLSPRRGRLIRRFMRFVFAEVLRVRRKGMKLQSEGSTHNNYYVVPTIRSDREDGTSKIDIDWAFLELIYQHTEEKKHSEIEKPILWYHDEEEEDGNIEDTVREKETVEKGKIIQNPLLKEGEVFIFDEQKYREAVVTPWYRNRDQPQFFLVAEICRNLTPDSEFPSAAHASFRDYYRSKYNAVLTQSNQPLLDVDHTSARLNLLTPRYVNRKGVALPVSSERTRRAKRDRLDQKQILVPELCRVHPFAAPLWFATVALPCVLYRINALLIADEIRRAVAIDVGLGIPKIDDNTMPGFQWPPLDFGWSLAEVLSADSEKKREEESKKEQKEKEMRDKVEKEIEQKDKEEECRETKEKTINEILQEKEEAENSFEIGTWSNDMASSIPETVEYDEFMEPLPPNLTFCTSASGGADWCAPIDRPKPQFKPTKAYSMVDSDYSYMSSDFDTDDSDLDSQLSDDETDTSGFCSSKNSIAAMGVRIEYKTAHEAEAVDIERKKVNPAPQPDEADDELDRKAYDEFIRSGKAPFEYIQNFRDSVSKHKQDIIDKGLLVKHNQTINEILPEPPKDQMKHSKTIDNQRVDDLFPYAIENLNFDKGQVTLESIERNKRVLLDKLKSKLSMDELKKLNCFSMVDVDIDSPSYVNEKVVNVGFDRKDVYMNIHSFGGYRPYYAESRGSFDFDHQPVLDGHPGPSPSLILQALTMSNANDGINLERLETIGDSFLKFAITAYLYCAHPTVHEGKLSHMRSKQVSNLNLYRLGRNKRLGARMIASKFEPHDNWLPPCHKPPPTLHPRTNESQEQTNQKSETPQDGAGCFIPYNLITQHSIPDKSIADCVEALIGAYLLECGPRGALLFMSWLGIRVLPVHYIPISEDHPYVKAHTEKKVEKPPCKPSPKRTRQSSSSSECSSSSDDDYDDDGPETQESCEAPEEWSWEGRPVGSRRPVKENGKWMLPIYGELRAPPSPLLRYIKDPESELEQMLSGYDALERTLQYRFKDRSLLLQALTHASHQRNRLTDCYQRLEFLGDAILDYLITRHLYEDPRRHSPGALTDLRSALVNNTIFATLAARHGFHKFFRHMSPGLNEVLTKYVKLQEENGHSISEEHYLIQEDEMEQAEDVEVPKALGDLFESVAGAIFLDSGMSLGAVWKSYVNLMGAELEAFSAAAPKSPVRELLEAEPDTAKFGKPERLADGRRVRVCVEVFGRGAFKGVGRNYRIAKGTAARCALRHLKIHKAR